MKLIFKLLLVAAVLAAFYSFWIYPSYSVPVLMYHSFDTSKGLLSVSPENFEKQMRYIKDHGYHVIALDEFVEGVRTKRKFPHNTVVITIDDGYQNNYTVAYPILRKYGFPATIFIITNVMDTKRSFFFRDGFLSWDEVKEMSRNGIVFGAHTKNHVYLPAIEDEQVLWDEIAGSKEAIEKHIGLPVYYFAYPSGGFNPQAKRLTQRAEYKAAFTTSLGRDFLNRRGLYELVRISVRNINPNFSMKNWWGGIRFRAKLSGYYYALRTTKSEY